MSTAANQPTGKKRSWANRLARFGVPVPPRIVTFFEGPELSAHDDVRAWGLPGWSGDTKLKVKWGSSRLADILEYASDGYFEDDSTRRFLPIAAVGTESDMFAVDVTSERLAVHFFDHESGFSEFAPDFDSFLARLLKKGERTPAEKLEKAYQRATRLNKDKDHAQVLATLEPVLALFPATVDRWDDTRDTLGAAWNLVGIAHEQLHDVPRAMAAYQTALVLGTDSAGLNICDLYLNDFADYAKLVELGEQQRERIYMIGSDRYAWFHIRNYLGRGYLLTGRRADAIRAYHQISTLAVTEPAKIREAVEDLRELVSEHPDADLDTAAEILAWLDAPPLELPADRLARMRSWWSGLPAPVAKAIREALHFEGEPTDADFARIVLLDELEVTNAELTDLAWASMLDSLEDLDVKGNQIRDLAPLSSLVRLVRLDVSENRVESLRPLAPLVRLERLSAGENPLAGLEGLEDKRHLQYLHVNQAGLNSLEPIRGLPDLDDLTIYDNAIADVSPLAESPRLKEVSCFSNPVERGLAELGVLPWLESIEAGEKTRRADVEALRAANPRVEIDDEFVEDDDADEDEDDEQPDPELPEIRRWWNALSDDWRKALDDSLSSSERGKRDPSDEALLELVRETSLHVDDRPLPADLSPLRRFTRLDYLNIGNSGTVDLGPIADLPRLRDLLIRKNPITSLAPLVAAQVLDELYMETCRIESLAGLERCFNLREIHADENLIADLAPLAELDQLRWLDFEHNRITSVAPLARLGHLKTLELGLNQITDLAPLAGCTNLRTLEIWANPNVKNAVALASLPHLTRIISHGALPATELAELRRLRPDILAS